MINGSLKSPRFNWEVAQFKVNVKADLSSFDNWNLKQVFLFLQFNYNSKEHVHSGEYGSNTVKALCGTKS